MNNINKLFLWATVLDDSDPSSRPWRESLSARKGDAGRCTERDPEELDREELDPDAPPDAEMDVELLESDSDSEPLLEQFLGSRCHYVHQIGLVRSVSARQNPPETPLLSRSLHSALDESLHQSNDAHDRPYSRPGQGGCVHKTKDPNRNELAVERCIGLFLQVRARSLGWVGELVLTEPQVFQWALNVVLAVATVMMDDCRISGVLLVLLEEARSEGNVLLNFAEGFVVEIGEKSHVVSRGNARRDVPRRLQPNLFEASHVPSQHGRLLGARCDISGGGNEMVAAYARTVDELRVLHPTHVDAHTEFDMSVHLGTKVDADDGQVSLHIGMRDPLLFAHLASHTDESSGSVMLVFEEKGSDGSDVEGENDNDGQLPLILQVHRTRCESG
ncbi:hypothetical protein N7539_005390 [Penicillium diatomitis]|uniref:Uncharacterized protein n=1 Tax=Penicillium diatomitis TaxID=2819901 RepID=A0A9X0BUY1_9EURO|nr:uncharacterized protein N7539_005390 [Penicillium diatomitis]KAJ5485402.1 hypothetical protein N7539_005390 [Penicillium diatomitis]